MASNTLREECINCNEIYLTNMAELRRSWISRCPLCAAKANETWANLFNTSEAK
jgi:hypothetical protein